MGQEKGYIDVPNIGKIYVIWVRSPTSDAWSKVDAPEFTSLGAAVSWAKLELAGKFRHIAIYRADHSLSWGTWWEEGR